MVHSTQPRSFPACNQEPQETITAAKRKPSQQQQQRKAHRTGTIARPMVDTKKQKKTRTCVMRRAAMAHSPARNHAQTFGGGGGGAKTKQTQEHANTKAGDEKPGTQSDGRAEREKGQDGGSRASILGARSGGQRARVPLLQWQVLNKILSGLTRMRDPRRPSLTCCMAPDARPALDRAPTLLLR